MAEGDVPTHQTLARAWENFHDPHQKIIVSCEKLGAKCDPLILKKVKEDLESGRTRIEERIRTSVYTGSDQKLAKTYVAEIDSMIARINRILFRDKPKATQPKFKGPKVGPLKNPEKSADALLRRSGLGQGSETGDVISDRHASQTRISISPRNIDPKNLQIPELSFDVPDSLLPFIVISRSLLRSTPGEPNRISSDDLQNIQSADSVVEIVGMMSESKRLFADNLEVIFGATYFGYFVEPGGIKAIDNVISVIDDLPKWTREMEKFPRDNVQDKHVVFMEKAMADIVSVFREYCQIINPSGGPCQTLMDFEEKDDNSERLKILQTFQGEIGNGASISVITSALQKFLDVVADLLQGNAKYTVSQLTGRGQRSTTPKTSRKRFKETVRELGEIKDTAEKAGGLSFETLDRIIELIGEAIADVSSVQAFTSEPEYRQVSSDLEKYYNYFVAERKKPGAEKPNVTEAPPTVDIDTKNAYVYLTYLTTVTFATRNILDKIFKPVKTLPKVKPLPASISSPEYAKTSGVLKNLPSVIDADLLIRSFGNTAATRLPGNDSGYEDIVNNLRRIFVGSDLTTSSNVYDMIPKAFNTKQWRELAGYVLKEQVKYYAGDKFNEKVVNMNQLSKRLYEDLGDGGYPKVSELARSIANLMKLAPRTIVDPEKLADNIASLTSPTEKQMMHVMIARETYNGVLERRVDHDKLAEFIARSLRQTEIPAWSKVILS